MIKTLKVIPFKSIGFGIKQRSEIFFVTRPPTYENFDSCFIISTKEQKNRDKTDLQLHLWVQSLYDILRFQGTIILNVPAELPVKSLQASLFSLISLNAKPLIKPLVERPQQILTNYVHQLCAAMCILKTKQNTEKIQKVILGHI